MEKRDIFSPKNKDGTRKRTLAQGTELKSTEKVI